MPPIARWPSLLGLAVTVLAGLYAYPHLTRQALSGTDYLWGAVLGGTAGLAALPELTRLAITLTLRSPPATFLLRARSTRAVRGLALALWFGSVWVMVEFANSRIVPFSMWAMPPALAAFVALLLCAWSEATSYFTLELSPGTLTIAGKPYFRRDFHHVSHHLVGKSFVFHDRTFRAFSSVFGTAHLDRAVDAIEMWSREPAVRR